MKKYTLLFTNQFLRLTIFFIAIISMMLLPLQSGSPKPYEVSQNKADVSWSITSYLKQVQDSKSNLDEILKLDQQNGFIEGEFSTSVGFTDSMYWIKISLTNNATNYQKRILHIGVSWLDEIDIYLIHDQKLKKEWHLGDKRPYQPQLFKQLHPEIHLDLPPGNSTIYLRAQTEEALLIPLDIISEENMSQYNVTQSYYFGVLYGALMIIALYNLFLYFSIREKSYLMYTLFIVSFILMNSSYSGFQYHLLFYNTPSLASHLSAVFIYLFQYTGVLFVMVFLNSKHTMPRIHKLLTLFLISAFSTQLFTTLFGFDHLLQSSSVIWAGIFGPMLLFVGVYVLFKRLSLVTKLFALGVLSSLIGTTITSFTAYGLLPFKFYYFHAVEIGFLIDAVLLSLALAARLKSSVTQQRTELAMLAINDGIWDWNVIDNSVYFSPRWKDIIGYKDNELSNEFSSWSERIHPDDVEHTMGDVHKNLSGETNFIENIHRLKHKNGHWVWILDRGKALLDDNGKLIRMIGTHTDITQRIEAENEIKKQKDILHYQAHHDALTGLPNRVDFTERLKEGIEKAKRDQHGLALFFIDLDKFKEINDSLGHDVGDKVLKIVAEILKKSIRQEDTLARLAGDEFTVIMENLINEKDASNVGHNILKKFEEPINIDDQIVYLTCSIGIALYPQDANNEKDLLKYADTAMYIAKESGRNNIQFYNSRMTSLALEQMKMKTSLRQAIENDEFIIHYQPQVDLTTKKIIGFEALVRWHHPKKGLLTPKRFIYLAEDTGMILEIDQWVMKTAMKQFSQWYKDGLNPGILALNVSMKHLSYADFCDNVQKNLELHHFKSEWLELEITEGHMMKDPTAIINKLKMISSLGISIAIDDFGTGYSSLSILKNLPINRLKIDKSFIEDIPEDEEDMAIIKSIITLAESLNLEIIAEGIETYEQESFLKSIHCTYVQGHKYFKPLSSQSVEKLLSTKSIV